MTIEDKAKAYDEAIERARNLYKDAVEMESNMTAKTCEIIFPELIESEGERIRKELIEFVKSRLAGFPQCEKFIAWLEKQGEHANFRNKIQVGDKVTRNEDGVLVNLSQLKRVAKKDEKYGEQKSTNKPEPKFKVGDWITDGNITIQIEEIKNNCYLYCGDCVLYSTKTADKVYHLWTINDAKAGDVLSYRDGQWIFIYKEKINDITFCSYALYSTIHQDLTIYDAGFSLLSDAIIPATKEQRDTLMKAMSDAGYSFDFEKKELKKIEKESADVRTTGYWHVEDIEQKPAEWSDEDELKRSTLIHVVKKQQGSAIFEGLLPEELINWLKSLKPHKKWKPSEEQISALDFAIDCTVYPEFQDKRKVLIELLEQLKQL